MPSEGFISAFKKTIAIRQDSEGRYCLNDCHRASGMGISKKPSEWLRNEQTREKIFTEKDFKGAPAIMVLDLTYHAKMKPSFVKEIGYNKESKIRTCSATVSAMADKTILNQYMEKEKQEIQNTLSNKTIFDNNIRYELQNTDDEKVQIKIQGMRL